MTINQQFLKVRVFAFAEEAHPWKGQIELAAIVDRFVKLILDIEKGAMAEGRQAGLVTGEAAALQLDPGMSLRAYFAARAPQDVIDALIGQTAQDAARFLSIEPGEYKPEVRYLQAVVKARYEYADAMVKHARG